METSRRLRRRKMSWQKRGEAREYTAQCPIPLCDDRAMQRVDPGDEFGGQWRRRFHCHPADQVGVRRRPAVESKPRGDVDERPMAIDEVRDADGAVPQVDGTVSYTH